MVSDGQPAKPQRWSTILWQVSCDLCLPLPVALLIQIQKNVIANAKRGMHNSFGAIAQNGMITRPCRLFANQCCPVRGIRSGCGIFSFLSMEHPPMIYDYLPLMQICQEMNRNRCCAILMVQRTLGWQELHARNLLCSLPPCAMPPTSQSITHRSNPPPRFASLG